MEVSTFLVYSVIIFSRKCFQTEKTDSFKQFTVIAIRRHQCIELYSAPLRTRLSCIAMNQQIVCLLAT